MRLYLLCLLLLPAFLPSAAQDDIPILRFEQDGAWHQVPLAITEKISRANLNLRIQASVKDSFTVYQVWFSNQSKDTVILRNIFPASRDSTVPHITGLDNTAISR